MLPNKYFEKVAPGFKSPCGDPMVWAINTPIITAKPQPAVMASHPALCPFDFVKRQLAIIG